MNQRDFLCNQMITSLPLLKKNLLKPTENNIRSQLSPMQFYVLLSLMHTSRSMSALAEECGIAKQQMTHLVDQLADRGLLSRFPSQDDRRKIFVTLTPQANQMLCDFFALATANLAEKLSVLSKSDMERLSTAFQTIHEILPKLSESSENTPLSPSLQNEKISVS